MNIQERSFGQRLRYERDRLHLSQEQLAEKIGGSVPSIQRWENGRAVPRADMLQKLYEIFGKTDDQWGRKKLTWSVPFLRNHYFTGRERILARLHKALTAENTVALTQTRAISGLGGIGKTQTALEYAYRYAEEYEAIFWVRAASEDTLRTDMAALADLLHLPERQETNQNRVIAAVKQWLEEHGPWLLIFDNVEDIEMILTFFPKRPGGAILLTTRSQVIRADHMKKIDLDKMEREEAVHFLLRRTTMYEDDEQPYAVSLREHGAAEQAWEMVDGLPLALDQAAAYIEESQIDIAAYVALYQTQRASLLKRRGSWRETEYPDSVATTWLLSFERVEQISIAAGDMLRLCAFLHPDAIPETMLIAGARELGSHLQALAENPLLLDELVGVLRKYSFLRRNPETKMLTFHRLVQAVLRDQMDRQTYQQWAEMAVRMVNHAFPDHAGMEFQTWARCEQYLPHVLTCTTLAQEEGSTSSWAASVLTKTGAYLLYRGQYAQSESLLKRAQAIWEQDGEREQPDMAETLDYLAQLYYERAKYAEAEPLYQQALALREQFLGEEHIETGAIVNNLALLYWKQEKYAEAEPLYQRAVAITEKACGFEHANTATTLNNLALLYWKQERYVEAEQLYQRTLAIREKILEPDHPHIAFSLDNLGVLYFDQGRYSEAEPLHERALSIREKVLGPEHTDTARSLIEVAKLYVTQGKYEQVESIYQRALAILEKALGREHPRTVETLLRLAQVYHQQGKHEGAEPLYKRVLAIDEEVYGKEHPDVATGLNDLAELYVTQERYSEAEPLYLRALTIKEQWLGDTHPNTRTGRENYAILLRKLGREQEAGALEAKNKSLEE